MRKTILKLVFFLAFFVFCSRPTLAWLDCPYGKINDSYPGLCELYIDTNENQICDQSEPAPETITGGEALSFYLIFFTLVFYFLHWYLISKTKLPKKFKWLNKASFRYFWNIVLLLSFLPTAVSSILLLLKVRSSFLSSLHNQAGIVFVTVALLHLFVRLRYFLKKP